MNINASSANSAYAAFSLQSVQHKQNAVEKQNNASQGDAAVKTVPSPTINTSGQKIGGLIDVKA